MTNDAFGEVAVLLLRSARVGDVWRERGWSGPVRGDVAQALLRRGWAVVAEGVRDGGTAEAAASPGVDHGGVPAGGGRVAE